MKKKCPVCDRFLIQADGKYQCRLHGFFTKKQLRDKELREGLGGSRESWREKEVKK